jgi:hypothetical protein
MGRGKPAEKPQLAAAGQEAEAGGSGAQACGICGEVIENAEDDYLTGAGPDRGMRRRSEGAGA